MNWVFITFLLGNAPAGAGGHSTPHANLLESLGGAMKLIDCSTPKHPNAFAMVDDADFDRLNQWKWGVSKKGNNFYAFRDDKMIGGIKGKTILMHALVIGTKPGMVRDHINGNGMDNRRFNLRFCTRKQNFFNSRKRKDGTTSRYKGVCFDRGANKFRSYITYNGKKIHLGVFELESDAALSYNNAAKIYQRDFAKLNQIERTTT